MSIVTVVFAAGKKASSIDTIFITNFSTSERWNENYVAPRRGEKIEIFPEFNAIIRTCFVNFVKLGKNYFVAFTLANW